MSRKSLTLALAAAVSLGAFALSSSTASAFHPSGGGIKASGVKSGGFQSNPHLVTGLKINNKPMVTGIVIKPKPGIITGIVIKPNHPHHAHWPRWWRYTTWGRPYWAAPVVAAGGVATYAATTNRCTCLTKEYTPQGAVVFKDVCTNEMAMNPPVSASPAAYMPEQPQQQGYLQPQAQ
jgi:hypothetical protein